MVYYSTSCLSIVFLQQINTSLRFRNVITNISCMYVQKKIFFFLPKWLSLLQVYNDIMEAFWDDEVTDRDDDIPTLSIYNKGLNLWDPQLGTSGGSTNSMLRAPLSCLSDEFFPFLSVFCRRRWPNVAIYNFQVSFVTVTLLFDVWEKRFKSEMLTYYFLLNHTLHVCA